eukprot:TRINITY_DN12092_c0_g1_i1.p1 TRINITY_DN12092_c0_g1~~TRINITY_DN12092_c0_g1_i1.p1  ORF type:complete len:256 (+),score=34.20 TRINITY_DN12092_c0_g1_i1:45-812(+)
MRSSAMSRDVEPTAQRSNVKDWVKGTQLCKFHQLGKCTRGSQCNFAHGFETLKSKPNFAKTRLCPQVRAGKWCAYAGTCTFAHSKEEMRETAQRRSLLEKRTRTTQAEHEEVDTHQNTSTELAPDEVDSYRNSFLDDDIGQKVDVCQSRARVGAGFSEQVLPAWMYRQEGLEKSEPEACFKSDSHTSTYNDTSLGVIPAGMALRTHLSNPSDFSGIAPPWFVVAEQLQQAPFTMDSRNKIPISPHGGCFMERMSL